MSTRNPTHGQKVTDPNAPVIKEGAGAVVSDSLAAESTREGGGFASNRDTDPFGPKGSNSTFTNRDTSSATRLDPTVDAEAREAESDWAEEKKLGASGGQRGNAGTAPSYVSSQFVDSKGPKGENLTEGFEGGAGNNASFNGAIGGRNDPGRKALDKIVKDNADSSEMAGMPKQMGDIGDNEFTALDRNTPA
ncbi:hypothetical protein HYFRA_00000458 [Hymenoscyphus fraxineus]|uniref:Uncharacterized protein n=1 Tax=Hymenoscyphus fraxineus TaxID=746836 RepID=A0A9N9L5W0_9HELO|nr:hypothetical protein HYFRA_00000458 [Hymenoscyphus fraxineus]